MTATKHRRTMTDHERDVQFGRLVRLPVDPVELRGTGRTTRMVDSLPAEGGYVVIVHNEHMIRYVKELIAERRGELVLRAGRVVRVSRERDNEQIRGLDLPFFVDHAYHNHCLMEWIAPYVRNWGVEDVQV